MHSFVVLRWGKLYLGKLLSSFFLDYKVHALYCPSTGVPSVMWLPLSLSAFFLNKLPLVRKLIVLYSWGLARPIHHPSLWSARPRLHTQRRRLGRRRKVIRIPGRQIVIVIIVQSSAIRRCKPGPIFAIVGRDGYFRRCDVAWRFGRPGVAVYEAERVGETWPWC